MTDLVIVHGNAIDFLNNESDEKYDMIYVDPPFGTGDVQVSARDSVTSYDDSLTGFEFLTSAYEWLSLARRVLKKEGTIYVHLDWHSVFEVKPVMDKVFGKQNFLNHVIWSYNFGGRGKNRFPRKHDDILVYTKEFGNHVFNHDDIDRIPYKAPEMQYVNRTKEEAERRIASGQCPTDVWDMSIVGTNARERTGYPSQKPSKLIERAIRASSPPGGLILDFFAGSGTTGAAAIACNRACVLIDNNPQAIDVMKKRFAEQAVEWR